MYVCNVGSIYRFLPRSFFGEMDVLKKECIHINPCQLLCDKRAFMYDFDTRDVYRLYIDILEILSVRLANMLLTAFSEMKVVEVDVTSYDFGRFFNDYTQNHKERYILVDVDSPFDSLLNIDFSNGQKTYNDVPFIDIDSASMIGRMDDLPAFELFKGCLLIVEKSALPSLSKEELPEVFECADESNEENLCLDVRVTINTQHKINYSRNNTIVKIKCKRINV